MIPDKELSQYKIIFEADSLEETAEVIKQTQNLISQSKKQQLLKNAQQAHFIIEKTISPLFAKLSDHFLEDNKLAEVITLEAENSPIFDNNIFNVGIKFRCGKENAPHKIELIADVENSAFILTIRQEKEVTRLVSFQDVDTAFIIGKLKDFLTPNYAKYQHIFDTTNKLSLQQNTAKKKNNPDTKVSNLGNTAAQEFTKYLVQHTIREMASYIQNWLLKEQQITSKIHLTANNQKEATICLEFSADNLIKFSPNTKNILFLIKYKHETLAENINETVPFKDITPYQVFHFIKNYLVQFKMIDDTNIPLPKYIDKSLATQSLFHISIEKEGERTLMSQSESLSELIQLGRILSRNFPIASIFIHDENDNLIL